MSRVSTSFTDLRRDDDLAMAPGIGICFSMPRFTPPDYETKFADFIRLCRESKKSGVKQIMVANPSVLGDTHDELVESLSRLAEAGLSLNISNAEVRGYSPMGKPASN